MEMEEYSSVRSSEIFDADFHNAEENFQLRTRLKSQLTYNLSGKTAKSWH